MTPELEDKVGRLPTGPGVYQHTDADGKVLYVGKAKNLRARVRSYFQESRPRDARLQVMLRKVADVEVIVTDTEVEALILENNLIKELKPRYNINLRDDKTYPFLCIKNEPFPRIFPTRRLAKDGSIYIGPYADVKRMKLVLRTIRGLFKIRTCSLPLSDRNIEAGKFQVCLEYHIKRCAGPCVGLQSQQEYDETIRQVRQLLNGKTKALIDDLRERMWIAASSKEFERAAELRDRIDALEKYAGAQKIVSADGADRDVCALVRDQDGQAAVGVILQIREGKVIGRRHKFVQRIAGRSEGELLQAFLEAIYTESTFLPDELLLSHELGDAEPLAQYLHQQKGRKVTLRVPIRGEKVQLMRMVESNARLLLDEFLANRDRRGEGRLPYAVTALQEDLRLAAPPRRIECIDISHLGGTGTVASCVVFEDGKPKKSDYRVYKIRSAEGKPDDYAAMREVASRRYGRIVADQAPWPDLIVIDGGKGQLSSVVEALKGVEGYGQAPVIGLAKRLEEVFFPGDTDSILIPKTSASLRLLQQIRDEAHRFAVASQRKQQSKKMLISRLREIPGVGEKTARKLLTAFGSVSAIREANAEELAGVVGPKLASRIASHLAK